LAKKNDLRQACQGKTRTDDKSVRLTRNGCFEDKVYVWITDCGTATSMNSFQQRNLLSLKDPLDHAISRLVNRVGVAGKVAKIAADAADDFVGLFDTIEFAEDLQ